MNDEVKFELNKILNELPTENSWLDYKAKVYDKTELAGLTNDLCAFLNSEQSYGKNKYIICGIGNDKSRLGIKPDEMLDDHFFQDAAKHIYPIPKIETGIFKHFYNDSEYNYGYILICKDNDDRIYEIYNEQIKKGDGELYTIKEIYEKNAFAPIAWIRVGSTKDKLKESMRRKIYDSDNLRKRFLLNSEMEYVDIGKSLNSKVIKTALLFGKWNEKNPNDKKIIEKFSNMGYNKFIEQFRLIAKTENNFTFKNGVWKINNRMKYIEYYATDFYKEDFDNFNSIAVEILKEKHPKLDLASDKRHMSNIYSKITKYSDEIRSGVAESLVLVEYLKNNFENCKVDASNFVILVIREILNKSSWYTWASLDNLLPFLAEASPSEFLNQFEEYLSRDKERKILFENETDIIPYNYSTSIYWSLELIAWNTDYFVRACMILSKLAKEDDKAIDHIVNIILPWYPNTFAPFTFRLTIVENILRKDISIGWKILKKIMPGETSYAVPTYKPKYINVPTDEIAITNEEYYNQIDLYLNLMIKYCKTNDERLLDLIDLLDNVSKDNFDKICEYLKTPKIIQKCDKSKYKLWDKLERLVYWISKHSDIKKDIKNEMIEKINDVIKYLKPRDELYVISRIFKKDNWELIEDYDNYELSEEKLHESQFDGVKRLYFHEGVSSIEKLSKIVEDPYSLGMIVAKLGLSINEEKNIILNNLDKRNYMIDFSKGYVYSKYNCSNEKYNNNLISNLSVEAKTNFLLMLPYNLITFKNVEKLLGNSYKKYWKKVDIRFVNDEETLKYSTSKLMEVHRYERILWMYRLSLHSNKALKDDSNIILTCLEKIDNNFNEFDICEAIKDLQQEKDVDVNRLFYIEWKFLPLLSDGNNRPITMEKIISSDANRYSEILQLAFKEHSKVKGDSNIDQNVATNAYRLLHQWKLVPGTKEDGYIDSSKLKIWYENMKDICEKIDRLEVGTSCFGKVLFYSPKDKSGFWIDKTVAEIINDNEIIREGYKTEALNSVGVVNCDENVTAYNKKRDEYKEKAETTELAGYYNFATALREIAHNFEFHAEHMKDTYRDF